MSTAVGTLRAKQKMFADEWLTGANTGKRFNGRAAYEYAGYVIPDSNNSGNASKLLRHPNVREYIQERLDEHTMDATEVLLRFTEIARSEMGDIVKRDPRTGALQVDNEAVVENSRFIKSFAFDSNGNPKIEFHDAVAALRDLARVHSMFHDSLEIGGPGGVPLTVNVNFVLPNGESAQLGPTNEQLEKKEDFSMLDADSGPVAFIEPHPDATGTP
tara:strand:- start:479 stop:1126 length:648 start_codon:yes stop_codon:yes gene_type:complete